MIQIPPLPPIPTIPTYTPDFASGLLSGYSSFLKEKERLKQLGMTEEMAKIQLETAKAQLGQVPLQTLGIKADLISGLGKIPYSARQALIPEVEKAGLTMPKYGTYGEDPEFSAIINQVKGLEWVKDMPINLLDRSTLGEVIVNKYSRMEYASLSPQIAEYSSLLARKFTPDVQLTPEEELSLTNLEILLRQQTDPTFMGALTDEALLKAKSGFTLKEFYTDRWFKGKELTMRSDELKWKKEAFKQEMEEKNKFFWADYALKKEEVGILRQKVAAAIAKGNASSLTAQLFSTPIPWNQNGGLAAWFNFMVGNAKTGTDLQKIYLSILTQAPSKDRIITELGQDIYNSMINWTRAEDPIIGESLRFTINSMPDKIRNSEDFTQIQKYIQSNQPYFEQQLKYGQQSPGFQMPMELDPFEKHEIMENEWRRIK